MGHAIARYQPLWFEEPVAPEDRQGYRELRDALDLNIAGGEAEFTRWGFRDLIEQRCVDILQPEVCGLGGISEYLKVLTLAQTHFLTQHMTGGCHTPGGKGVVVAKLPLIEAAPARFRLTWR